jgi:hypothetical protein
MTLAIMREPGAAEHPAPAFYFDRAAISAALSSDFFPLEGAA